MRIGYARVSTQDQTLNLRQNTLTKAGCTKIFTDTASDATTERKGLEQALSYVRKGDTLYQFDLTAPCMTVALDKLRKGSLIYDSIRWNWY